MPLKAVLLVIAGLTALAAGFLEVTEDAGNGYHTWSVGIRTPW